MKITNVCIAAITLPLHYLRTSVVIRNSVVDATRSSQCLRTLSRGCGFVVISLVLAACSGVPKPSGFVSNTDALNLFDATTKAHGRDAFLALKDLSIAYDSHWYQLIQKIQPVLTDGTFRGGSEERLLLRAGVTAQKHQGQAGSKFVLRQRDYASSNVNGSTQVWFNGELSPAPEIVSAAALVVDAYRVFILGPFHYLDGDHYFEMVGTAWIDGRLTDKLLISTRPGLGDSEQDSHLLFIDREDKLVRRIRFTLEGLDSTRGAVVETDFSEFRLMHGVLWPTQFFERVTRPIPNLPAHRWSLLGLDVNRGLSAKDFEGGRFSNKAAQPAQRLKPLSGASAKQ